MKHETIVHKSRFDATILHGDFYRPEGADTMVVIFHGMAEHRLRYQEFIDACIKEGYAVLSLDHRGHFQSGDVLGFFADKEGWRKNLEDLHDIIRNVNQPYGYAVNLFGHSMGSLFARAYLKYYDTTLNKVMLSGSPSYNSASKLGIALCSVLVTLKGSQYVSSFVEHLATGSFNKAVKNPKTKFDWISKNEVNVRSYIESDFCGFPFTVSGYRDLFRVMNEAYSEWTTTSLTLPIRFFSGSEDPCLGGSDKMTFAVQALKKNGYQCVDAILYPGLRHEILMETQHKMVIQDLIDFMKR